MQAMRGTERIMPETPQRTDQKAGGREGGRVRTEGEEDDDWMDFKVLPKQARLLSKRKIMRSNGIHGY